MTECWCAWFKVLPVLISWTGQWIWTVFLSFDKNRKNKWVQRSSRRGSPRSLFPGTAVKFTSSAAQSQQSQNKHSHCCMSNKHKGYRHRPHPTGHDHFIPHGCLFTCVEFSFVEAFRYDFCHGFECPSRCPVFLTRYRLFYFQLSRKYKTELGICDPLVDCFFSLAFLFLVIFPSATLENCDWQLSQPPFPA